MKKLIGLILFLISANIYAWNVFGPKDYDECILENMKGVNSDVGARLVNKSCHEKFRENSGDVNMKNRWTLFSYDNEKSVYDDYSSLTKHGEVVTVDMMMDFNKVQVDENKQFYSVIGRIEHDCMNLVFRELRTELKSGHMATGATVSYYGLQKETKITKDDVKYKRYCNN